MEQKEKERFSLVKRLKSSNHAWRGIGIFLKTTHNAWVHIFFGVLAAVLGFLLRISPVEWTLVIVAVFFVLITEAINTAIEIDIDLTSPDHHPFARDTKDVAAASVAIAIILAGVVGLIIFLPKVLEML